jgi:hypothetical protein
MLFGETVAVYCENHTEHTDTVWAQLLLNNTYKSSPYLTGNKLRRRYKPQQVNAVWETIAVYCENHTEHRNILCGRNAEFQYMLKRVVHIHSNHWALKG